jgi:hypothetical protein
MDINERKYKLIEQCIKISTLEDIERAEYFFENKIETSDLWDHLPENVQKLIIKSKAQSAENESLLDAPCRYNF